MINLIDQNIIESIHQYCGVYIKLSSNTVVNRLAEFLAGEKIDDQELLHSKLKNDNAFGKRLINSVSIGYTEFFRDPEFFRYLSTSVFPYLSTFNKIRIWHIGCSSGEEPYSLAILLSEYGLLHRCEIISSDINTSALEHAVSGEFSLQRIRNAALSYHLAGGRNNFARYFQISNNKATITKNIFHSIKFTRHNFLTDQSFNSIHLIMCRNVSIYLSPVLQYRAEEIFQNAIDNYSYLTLGMNEWLLVPHSPFYRINKLFPVYRKIFLNCKTAGAVNEFRNN